MNINSHKLTSLNMANNQTPQASIIGIKKRSANPSILNSRKSPVIKNLKKVGVYSRSRPPLYERDLQDNNVSSLPVIINSLSPSQKRSVDANSQERMKKYELKGKVIKPSQRLAHLRYSNKVKYPRKLYRKFQ